MMKKHLLTVACVLALAPAMVLADHHGKKMDADKDAAMKAEDKGWNSYLRLRADDCVIVDDNDHHVGVRAKAFIPLMEGENKNYVLYTAPTVRWHYKKKLYGDILLGYRHIVKDTEAKRRYDGKAYESVAGDYALGAYLYGGIHRSPHDKSDNYYGFGGVGIEAMNQNWDIRADFKAPFGGKRDSKLSPAVTSLTAHDTSTHTCEVVGTPKDVKERPYYTVSGELGHVFYLNKWFGGKLYKQAYNNVDHIRVFGGGAYHFAKDAKDAHQVHLGVELLKEFMAAEDYKMEFTIGGRYGFNEGCERKDEAKLYIGLHIPFSKSGLHNGSLRENRFYKRTDRMHDTDSLSIGLVEEGEGLSIVCTEIPSGGPIVDTGFPGGGGGGSGGPIVDTF